MSSGTAEEIDYLYTEADQRMYKRTESTSDTTEEYYLKNLGVLDMTSGNWTWYVNGADRVAKVIPRSYQQPDSISVNMGADSNHVDVSFYLYDHLGNTRVVYTPNERACILDYTLEYAGDYYPYGKVLREYANGQVEKFLTTQHERDQETGLDYRGARFYDSDIGRFLSLDPLAVKYVAYSPFSYVLGNPIFLSDPNGKEPIKPLAGGLSNLVGSLQCKEVSNASDFHHNTGSNWFKNAYESSDADPRYIYTNSAGWIDIKHFAGAAYVTSLFGSSIAIKKGESQEWEQYQDGALSAYSYEDLTSNMLGAYFQSVYLNSSEAKGMDYIGALERFFQRLGAVEDWENEAPNMNQVGDSYAAEDDSGIKSYNYNVVNNTDSSNDLLTDIYKWMKEEKGINPNSNRKYAREQAQKRGEGDYKSKNSVSPTGTWDKL